MFTAIVLIGAGVVLLTIAVGTLWAIFSAGKCGWEDHDYDVGRYVRREPDETP